MNTRNAVQHTSPSSVHLPSFLFMSLLTLLTFTAGVVLQPRLWKWKLQSSQDHCCSSLQEWQSPHIQVATTVVEPRCTGKLKIAQTGQWEERMNPDCIDWLSSFYGQEWWRCSQFHGLRSWLRCRELCGHFPAFSPIIICGRKDTNSQEVVYTCMHSSIFRCVCAFSSAIDVGCCSGQLKENCNRNSIVGRLSPASFLIRFQRSACSCSTIDDIRA